MAAFRHKQTTRLIEGKPSSPRNTGQLRDRASKNEEDIGRDENASCGGGWRIQFSKTSWVAFPFDFGMGGPLSAHYVVADLQVGAFALRRLRIASLKTGHYKIGQQEHAPSLLSSNTGHCDRLEVFPSCLWLTAYGLRLSAVSFPPVTLTRKNRPSTTELNCIIVTNAR